MNAAQTFPASSTTTHLQYMTNEERERLADEIREVLAEARLRGTVESARLGHELGWDKGWLAENCLGDGFERHPLLAGPGDFRREGAVVMSGLVVDGRVVHSHAAFGVRRRYAQTLRPSIPPATEALASRS